MKALMDFYLHSPIFIRQIAAEIEAINRDRKRRDSIYRMYMRELDFEDMMLNGHEAERGALLQKTLRYAANQIPAYNGIDSTELSDYPLLDKSMLRHNYSMYVADKLSRSDYVEGRTSGSTGTPLHYFTDRDRVAFNYACCDKHLLMNGAAFGDKKIRISGVSILPPKNKKPPYSIYIRHYNQRQFSAYHICTETAKDYFNEISGFADENTYGTGYAKAWSELARIFQILEMVPPSLKVIRLDSEGISEDERKRIEKVFRCPVFLTYGLSEIGQFAFQCSFGHYHFIPEFVFAEIIKSNDYNTCDNSGEIVLTTLHGNKTPLIRYRTGDIGTLGTEKCPCGMNTQYLISLEGRVDDYVVIGGTKIFRLSHLLKTDKGVTMSQIVQTEPDKLLIRIIPDSDFSPAVFDEIRRKAIPYIGDAHIDFEIVTELEKTASGKIRYIVRK